MGAASREFLKKSRADVAKNPEKYTSRRILSSVDRSSGATRQDITDQAIAERDAKSSQVEPGMMEGTQVVQPAHSALNQPVQNPHSYPLTNPFIHSRPPSDLTVRNTPLSETIEKATDNYKPEYTPEETVVMGEMLRGESVSPMYTPEQRANIAEDIKEKGQFESASVMRLGTFEPVAQNYEEGVANTLSPLTGSTIGPLRAVGGVVESIAYIPTAVPRLAVGLVRDPTATVRGATEGLAETVVTDPWRGGGQIAGMVFGPKMIGKTVKYGPTVKRANVVSIEGGGSNPSLTPINYGWTANVLDKPVLTHVTGKGFVKGAGSAPAELLQGRTITAFSTRETALFRTTVDNVGGAIEGQYFGPGYEIAKGISKNKKPIVEPDSFKVTSEHVPDSAKPIVEESIRTYPGDIEVYGSASQKLQMGEHMKRTPQDIEVVVDNPIEFVSLLEKNFKGTDINYNIKGLDTGKPKVEFMTDRGLVKGIEIFGRDTPVETTGGYIPGADIAYGFKSQNPINIDGVLMMRLSEQGPRKLAGGNVLKDGKIDSVHPGRMKDVGDLIEIGAAYEIEKGIGIQSSLIKYSEIAKQKGASSSVMDFIVENKRIPKKSEFVDMVRDPADVIKSDIPDILYQSPGRSSGVRSTRSNLLSPNIINVESSIASSIASDIGSTVSPPVLSNSPSIFPSKHKSHFSPLINSPFNFDSIPPSSHSSQSSGSSLASSLSSRSGSSPPSSPISSISIISQKQVMVPDVIPRRKSNKNKGKGKRYLSTDDMLTNVYGDIFNFKGGRL